MRFFAVCALTMLAAYGSPCFNDIEAASLQIAKATENILSAVTDCPSDPTKCTTDISNCVEDLSNAAEDINKVRIHIKEIDIQTHPSRFNNTISSQCPQAVGDCGGSSSACGADILQLVLTHTNNT